MRESIKDVLMKRDGMSTEEAEDLISQAIEDLHERLAKGEMPHDICMEWFRLEPDYLDELIF
jgi:20S proteasome alpha/beta subunit